MSNTRIEWETEEESPKRSSAQERNRPFTAVFAGADGAERAASLQRRLTGAVDSWWQQGKIPPIGLVRDALLALEAGHRLEEAERTLLLRGALFYGKGMRTALHHLNDPERAASVMRDMLLHPVRPLSPGQITELARQDDESAEWIAALDQLLLEEMAQPLEPRRTLAQATHLYLHESKPAKNGSSAWIPLAAQMPSPAKSRGKRRVRIPPVIWRTLAALFGLLALALLVLSLAFFWLDQQQSVDPAGEMIAIPTGVYRISDPAVADTDRLVELAGFSIDRFEVTNQLYRLCFESGGCTWPARTASITRPDYFLNPGLGSFPMVNVTHEQAALFCRWAGKRLPLEEEWEVAASSALTLRRAYRYPWGDNFERSRANGISTAVGDTLPVGTYSPGGDSPSGAADMAGNVAEWTASPGNPPNPGAIGYIVKGGSFQDDADGLRANQRTAIESSESLPWLGFRCAVTNPTK